MQNIEIGSPVVDMYGSTGYVAEILAATPRTFTLGTGRMVPIMAEYLVAFPNRVSQLADSIIAPMVDRAAVRRLEKISAEEVAKRRAEADRVCNDVRTAAQRAQEERDERARLFYVEAESRVPSWAKAVIVAEMQQDDSDSMSDYFNSKTLRTVILGFSTHTRDLFPELRKFAATFPETAGLATAPDDAEHREKWSMGAGYYLKAGGRHSTGWRVSKRGLYGHGHKGVPVGEWFEPVKASAPAPDTGIPMTAQPDALAGAMTIEEHTHTKKGFQMFVCVLADRVERDEFDRLRDDAQARGGWYSRPWGKTPGGFAFKLATVAAQFVAAHAGAPSPEPEPPTDRPPTTRKPEPVRADGERTAERLRELADGMQAEIDNKLSPNRLTNTPKRMREAGNARIDGHHLQRTQAALRALADLHAAGGVPRELARLRSKSAVHALTRSKVDFSGGYYDSGRDSGEPCTDSDLARAVWGLIGRKSDADRAAEELRQKITALQFANIPGYFPTPPEIAARMIEAADMPAGPCDVLEPSAGSGNIVDAIRAAAPSARVIACERHYSLREILKAKGVELVGSDFLEEILSPVDRVLMNPPFENGQGMEHVRRACGLLRPGGVLVAIMSPGPFYRSDRKSTEFRAWFDELDGERIDIPAGAFKASGTGVASVMVTIKREG